MSRDRFFDRLRQAKLSLYQEREDLQQVFDGDEAGLWRWIHNFGPLEDDRLRALLPAMPAASVMRFAAGDENAYRHGGAEAQRMILSAADRMGVSISPASRVLDFGCGPGRVLRYFLHEFENSDFHGVDVDRKAIRWCRRNIPFASFTSIKSTPPTPLSDQSIDLAYSVSVFTHLSLRSHREWLAELARLVRPGGLVIMTVHGRRALERAERERPLLDLLAISSAQLSAAKSGFVSQGFSFVPQEGHLKADEYGIAFASPDFLRVEWEPFFELVELESAALQDWQDGVVLLKK